LRTSTCPNFVLKATAIPSQAKKKRKSGQNNKKKQKQSYLCPFPDQQKRNALEQKKNRNQTDHL
jgi:hypothetical protein